MKETNRFVRFTRGQRIEHILLILSFTTLVVTGLPQKFAGADWAEGLIAAMGGIELVRVIHRIAAVSFILETIYHIVVLGYKIYVQRAELSMLPTLKDLRDGVQAFAYNLGLAKQRPKMGRFTFDEKAEYWALIWGSVVMILTGFMLWNPIATTGLLPGQFIPAAKAAHGGEALLAALAIVVWHLYHVHIKFFNKSMFIGTMTRHEMLEEHPLELEAIESETTRKLPPAQKMKARRNLYFPVAAVLTLGLAVGLYYFLSFEQTAIETVPPVSEVPVFVPRTPTPMPTQPPQPTGAPQEPGAGSGELTWNGSVGALFDQRCGACHGNSGGFSGESYADAMQGSANGPMIIAGNADTSPLVILMAAGSHPGKFTPEELDLVKGWINAGAPEN